jgi:uncharacterized protein (DUF2141 family)
MRHSIPVLIGGLCLAASAGAADLTIELAGVRSESGHLMIAVYDSAATFRREGEEAVAVRVRAHTGPQQITLGGLPEGSYAIAVYHDENLNRELDTNLLGLPTEGRGFSNDAAGRFGPPDFEAAKLVLGAGPTRSRVALVY